MSERANEQHVTLGHLVDAFDRRIATGESLTAAQFIAQHPEHANELRDHFANVSSQAQLEDTSTVGIDETIAKSSFADHSSDDAIEATIDLPASKGGTPEVRSGDGDSEASLTWDSQPSEKPAAAPSANASAKGPRRPKSKSKSKSASTPAIPKTFGRYTIQKVLGQGAMGAVYLARDTQLDRDVALKVPKFGDGARVDNDAMLERFYREARASATLRSPNICPVYDVGEIDGQHYITMAYIEGRPLRDFTKSKKKHSEKHIVMTIGKLAIGLDQAHNIGVIHRDLKPANIMVDLRGEPVVMDFGLARRSSSDDVQLTQSGAIIGTPAYMAPEQIVGDQSAIDHRVDIYALGVIMYELITGEMPYQGNLMSILQQISLSNPTKPAEIRKSIDPRLEAICLKMMAGDQTQRYQSMKEVATDLQQMRRNLPKQKAGEPKAKQAADPKSVPATIPMPSEESNPALISIAGPKSYAEQRRERTGRSSRKANSKTRAKATSQGKSGRASGPPKKWLLAGGLGGALLLMGIMLMIRIGKYDVQLTLDDPSITLSVDGEVVNIKDGQDVYRLSAGEHNLKLQKDGLTTHVEEFTVSKDGKTTVRALIVNGKLDGLLNGEQPGDASGRDARASNARANISPSNITATSPGKPRPRRQLVGPTFSDGTPLQTSLRFSKLNDEVSFPSLMDQSDALTMEVWLQRDQDFLLPHSAIVGFRTECLLMSDSGSRLDFWCHEDPLIDHASDALNWDKTGIDQAVHLAGVRDPARRETRFYVDGKLTETISGNFLRGGGFLQIGTNDFQWGGEDFCFKGWIDELRISNSVRFEQDFQPRRTFDSDASTIGLYHFDEGTGNVLKDASGNGHDGQIIGAIWVPVDAADPTPPVIGIPMFPEPKASTDVSGSNELEFDVSAFVEVPSLKLNGKTPMTIEAFVTCGPKANWSMLAGVEGGFGLVIQTSDHAVVRWDASGNHLAMLKVMTPGERLHFAGVYTGEKVLAFLDGKLVDTVDRPEIQTSDAVFKMGLEFEGKLGPVRVSSGARYQSDFTPNREMRSDNDTLALYQMDEGGGAILNDSSGNGHHGKIVGATWGTASTDAISK